MGGTNEQHVQDNEVLTGGGMERRTVLSYNVMKKRHRCSGGPR